ncbi:molybdopterin-dependent oxidoreductase [Anatilimnocola floriformis]|uniref:molybdopterin-dependent oxidoreductase n=1 Tax=Anatilimnocola floriformis TaxID=2948575 RepID=UPI0020C59C81|nr:molybdopterin-dependent oxidoreductase [Anatilimnocola floriformis]
MTDIVDTAIASKSTRRRWLAQAAAVGSAAYLGSNLLAQEKKPAEPPPPLIVRQEAPFNAEPEMAELVKSYVTPVEQFYVRSHGAVPKVDADSFRVKISGLVNRELEFSVAELKDKFDTHKIGATLTCAGNRRQELSAIKKVAGVQWDAGAIGHANWMGALLSEVLAAAELQPGAKHIWLEGLDPIKEKDGSEAPFGGSIPLEKALAKNGDNLPSLLTHTMNDKPLTPEHGAPLRLIVPGYIGARSVKWLAKIIVSDKPSPNHYLAEAYKVIQTDDKEEAAKANPIYEFPFNVAIGLANGAKLKPGFQYIRGYALPQGVVKGGIAAVEVSANNGRTWTFAEISSPINSMSWRLWGAAVNILPGKQTLLARVRPLINGLESSPAEQGQWNLKGYLYNGWHRVRVEGI